MVYYIVNVIKSSEVYRPKLRCQVLTGVINYVFTFIFAVLLPVSGFGYIGQG